MSHFPHRPVDVMSTLGCDGPQGTRPARAAERSPASDRPGVEWIPPGTRVVVANFPIDGGLLFVGTVRGREPDPSYIDPRLPVSVGHAERADEIMPYWPSYSRILPMCRAAYLAWLAGGRRDPAYGVSYVFLFFYGLERRILLEREQCAPGEVGAILDEVEQLLEVYGGDRSFRTYATSFLESVRASHQPAGIYRGPARLGRGPASSARELTGTARLSVGLAQAAADRVPLPAPWALAWCRHERPARFRNAARCPRQLNHLFAIRYRGALGQGVLVPPGESPLVFPYRPASLNLLGRAGIPTGLSDVLGCVSVPPELDRIAAECCRDLDAYARRRGPLAAPKHPLASIALLPQELVSDEVRDRLRGLRTWLDAVVPPDAPVLVPALELLARWTDAAPARVNRHDATELAELLYTMGVGIDPDPRFEGGTIVAAQRVALFRLPADAWSGRSPAYLAAALIVQLSTAVANADGDAPRGARERVEELIAGMEGLPEAERHRLRACAVRRFETRAALGPLAKRVRLLAPGSADRLGKLLVGVASPDGRLHPRAIVVLEKIYRALGLDPAAVYRDAQERATDTVPADEPVTVRRREPPRPTVEYALPPQHAQPGRPRVEIDEELLARKQAETTRVLADLAEVFVDDPVAPAAPAPKAGSDVAGLDARHAALLRRLAARGSWTRADLETVCKELDLLPDGALEVVNDTAFDHAGVPVIEGDDPLVVDQDAIRRWTS